MKHKEKEGENSNQKGQQVRMELKYCERCGGLWVRESGTTEVYCRNCQRMVDDLPIPKKKPGRIELPLGQRPLVEHYDPEEVERRERRKSGLRGSGAIYSGALDEDSLDLESAGGAA